MRTLTRRICIVSALVGLGAMAGGAPAGAQSGATPTVQPASIAPGATFAVSGQGCDGMVTVDIADFALSQEVGTNGPAMAWSASFTAPSNATPGPHTITSSCSYFTYADASITITGAVTTTTTSTTTSTSTSTTVPPTTTTTLGTTTTTQAPVAVAATTATPSFTG